jgi:hypothetical protein
MAETRRAGPLAGLSDHGSTESLWIALLLTCSQDESYQDQNGCAVTAPPSDGIHIVDFKRTPT